MSRYLSPADPVVAVHPTRISWGAVFAGVLLASMTYLFLGMLGTALGAGSFDPLGRRDPFAGFGTGAGIWLGLSTLVSLAVGAFFAGRSAPRRGTLHGVLSGSVSILVTLYLLAGLAGSAIGAASGMAKAGLSLAGQGVAAAAPGLASGVAGALHKDGDAFDFSNWQGRLDTLLRQTGKPELAPSKLKQGARDAVNDGKAAASDAAANPQQASDDLGDWFASLRQRANPALNAADKSALVNLIMARTGKSRAEAEQIADNYAQAYDQAVAKYQALKQQAEQRAREAGELAARKLSQAAWAAAALLLLGMIVSGLAGFAGWRSNPDRDVARV